MNDEAYMRMALEEAKRGRGAVNPNPLVGAVIVLGGEVLSTGYHTRYGELHAERQALANLEGKSCEGATMYVTLEPCCHHGKQPPCTDAIIAHKLARVVIGSRDPNPLVAGKGARILREAGIEVSEDVLRAECDAVNHVFMHYITTHRPYVMMKTAMTLDGKIACHTGASRWVTGEAARAYVQEMRNHYKGIMVGVGTVLADNPRLTCRLEGGRNPVRIVCDSHLRTPLASILGSSSMLLEQKNLSSEERDELAWDIQKEAHWLIRVTENILSVTKFTGSDVKLKKEDEAVEEIVSSAIVKFRRHHPEMSITVKRPESILWAPMDATLVEQVLLNLFENAVAHGKNANTIQVSILPEPGRAAVVVEDNGAGFSPEALEHLFDGLQPAGTGHSDNRRHMGIGLNVCRSIIRAHGGEITAGNGREGGAEIRFWLPREEEEEQDE